MSTMVGMPYVGGTNGMVVSASPLASAQGLNVLMQGGNAVDAAITVAALLSIDEPHFSGIGGHGIMMLYLTDFDEVRCLDFGGFAPGEFSMDQWGTPPRYDERSIASSVFPATLAGWAEALERYGTQSLADALAPAIDQAHAGIPARPVVCDFIARLEAELRQFPELARIVLPEGRPPRPGEIIKYTDLARTYEEIARNGWEFFYKGDLADRVRRYYNEQGARFSRQEFETYRPIWRDTVSTSYRDSYRVIVPKCQVCSPVVLTQLNIWESFDMAALGHLSPDSVHLGIEAAKIAFADRKHYCGDPDFSRVPYDMLASKAYARDLAAQIDMAKAEPERPVSASANREGTTHLTVVDRHRNAVAITQTLGPDFGCMQVVPGTGIILNNEGVFFDLDPVDGPNYPQPGKRSQHDMSPTIVLKHGRLFLALGTPGALGITQTIPQVIVNVCDHGLGLQQAVEADRYRYYGEGRVRLGDGLPASTREALRAKGHDLLPPSETPIWAGGFNAVMIDPDTGTLSGGADPRRGGLAIGF